LLPALVLTPALGWCRSLLEWLGPSDVGEVPGKPGYLTSAALNDPGTAITRVREELARLVGLLEWAPRTAIDADEGGHQPVPAFVALGQAIEQFAARLATTGEPSETQAGRLQSLRGALSTVRHLEDAIADVCNALRRLGADPEEAAVARGVTDTLEAVVARAAEATDRPDPDRLHALIEDTRKHRPPPPHLHRPLHPHPTPLPP